MQDLAGCDNNRTPVRFQGYDNCNFVGEITSFVKRLFWRIIQIIQKAFAWKAHHHFYSFFVYGVNFL
jgi:hypothetical protein